MKSPELELKNSMDSKVRIKICMEDLLDMEKPGDILLELNFKKGDSVLDILERIRHRFNPNFDRFIFDSENRRLRDTVLILRNDRVDNLPEGIYTRLQDGDVLTLLPILNGG